MPLLDSDFITKPRTEVTLKLLLLKPEAAGQLVKYAKVGVVLPTSEVCVSVCKFVSACVSVCVHVCACALVCGRMPGQVICARAYELLLGSLVFTCRHTFF